MGKFKKLTATILSAVMVLSVMNFTAFAAGTAVAKIGDVEYETLNGAVEAAVEKSRIELLDNVEEDIVIPENKNIVLDLNGKSIKNSSDHTIINNGVLKIVGNGRIDNVTHGKGALVNNNEAILEDTTFTRSQEKGTYEPYENGGNSWYTIANYGKMSIEDCNVEALGGYSSLIRNGKENIDNAKLTIYSGNFSGGINTVKNDENGILKIEDGIFENTTQATILNWNKTEINGGKFVTKQGNSIISGYFSEDAVGETVINGGKFESENYPIAQFNGYESKKLEINGGEFISKRDDAEVFDNATKEMAEDDEKSFVITNGKFTCDVSDFIDEDSHLVKDEDGNFVVMDEEKYEDYLDDNKSHGSRYELEEKENDSKDDDDEDKEEDKKPEEPEEESIFGDVAINDPNYDAIVKVFEKGWMVGVSDGVFAANGTLTRGMAATILWNKAGKPEPVNAAPFLDVTADVWYAKAVAWAYEQGIVLGYDAETFGPNDFVTTEQFTIMLDKSEGKTPAPYAGGAPNATRGWVASKIA